MSKNAVVLSIRPEYAKKIFDGAKTVELRRTCPRVKADDLIIVYVSSPVRALGGFLKVSHIIKETPEKLWFLVGPQAGVSKLEFDNYYSGASIGFALCIVRVRKLDNPLCLEQLKARWPGFLAPQSYRYVRRNSLKKQPIGTPRLGNQINFKEKLDDSSTTDPGATCSNRRKSRDRP